MVLKLPISSQKFKKLNKINWFLFKLNGISLYLSLALTLLTLVGAGYLLLTIDTNILGAILLIAILLGCVFCFFFTRAIIYDDVIIIKKRLHPQKVSIHIRHTKINLINSFGSQAISTVYTPLLTELKKAGVTSIILESPNSRLIKSMAKKLSRTNPADVIISPISSGRLSLIKTIYFKIFLRKVMKENNGVLSNHKSCLLPTKKTTINILE